MYTRAATTPALRRERVCPMPSRKSRHEEIHNLRTGQRHHNAKVCRKAVWEKDQYTSAQSILSSLSMAEQMLRNFSGGQPQMSRIASSNLKNPTRFRQATVIETTITPQALATPPPKIFQTCGGGGMREIRWFTSKYTLAGTCSNER